MSTKLKEILKDLYFIYPFVFIFLALNSTLLIFSSLKYPSGIRIFTNKSYSMSPTITPSDVIVVMKQYPYSYDKGDIITFYSYARGKNRPMIITHRIYRLGGNVYITKGDTNLAIDKEYVRPRLIIGKVVVIIPYLGIYLSALKNKLLEPFLIPLPALYIILIELYNIHAYVEEINKDKNKNNVL